MMRPLLNVALAATFCLPLNAQPASSPSQGRTPLDLASAVVYAIENEPSLDLLRAEADAAGDLTDIFRPWNDPEFRVNARNPSDESEEFSFALRFRVKNPWADHQEDLAFAAEAEAARAALAEAEWAIAQEARLLYYEALYREKILEIELERVELLEAIADRFEQWLAGGVAELPEVIEAKKDVIEVQADIIEARSEALVARQELLSYILFPGDDVELVTGLEAVIDDVASLDIAQARQFARRYRAELPRIRALQKAARAEVERGTAERKLWFTFIEPTYTPATGGEPSEVGVDFGVLIPLPHNDSLEVLEGRAELRQLQAQAVAAEKAIDKQVRRAVAVLRVTSQQFAELDRTVSAIEQRAQQALAGAGEIERLEMQGALLDIREAQLRSHIAYQEALLQLDDALGVQVGMRARGAGPTTLEPIQPPRPESADEVEAAPDRGNLFPSVR